eukprot:5952448-Prymnesium_polylepis.1
MERGPPTFVCGGGACTHGASSILRAACRAANWTRAGADVPTAPTPLVSWDLTRVSVCAPDHVQSVQSEWRGPRRVRVRVTAARG